MPGMEFEYDEKGGTSYYFLLSFIALLLFPATYYFRSYLLPSWSSESEDEKNKKACRCDPCLVKRDRLRANEPMIKYRQWAVKLLLLLGWVAFICVAYKTTQVELDFTEFDPFQELNIDRGATKREIKKAYHELSLIYHPDKETGDSARFMRITKAYQALTDEEARKNWEEHGNPDGPGAMQFGIALPKWIVEKQNSVWVLGMYALVFMVILPIVVGSWWYRSIKYSAEQILMDTTHLYYYFFNKTPNMVIKRVVMILAASHEYARVYNSEIVERPSDNEEIPFVMRDLPYLNEKNKEKPLCFPFSVKARTLIHAHLTRLPLPPNTLEKDKNVVLKKSVYLVNEMINIVAQLVALAHAGRAQRVPRLDTIENCMKLSQMIVQGLWDNKSPLLQLPHIKEDMLRHFTSRKRNIRSIHQFMSLSTEDKRALLRSLSDSQFEDIVNVCSKMPHVTMEESVDVLDDDDHTLTAGAIVTVTVRLNRTSLEEYLEKDSIPDEETKDEEKEENVEENAVETQETPKRKKQQQKNKKGKVSKNKKKAIKKEEQKPSTVGALSVTNKDGGRGDDADTTPNGDVKPKAKPSGKQDGESTDDESAEDSDADASGQEGEEDDEYSWKKFQEESKKENVLETKSKDTHIVHCPHFPIEKHEWWWVYIADRKAHSLITHPVQVCSLKAEEEVSLKFSAPPKPGVYHYSLILRSDCYMDFDQIHNIKLDVKEAKKVESHPQWDISEDEDEKEGNEESESDYSGDESDED